MADKTTEIAPRERISMKSRESLGTPNPFTMLERFADEMHSLFDDYGVGRGWLRSRWNPEFGRPTELIRRDVGA